MGESPVVLLVALRWLHAIAAAMWLGGGLLVLALRAQPVTSHLSLTAGRTLRVGVAVFILTGALLTTSRLTEPNVPGTYVAVLGVKIALAFVMFWLAMPRKRREPGHPRTWWPAWANDRTVWIVAIGLAVYLLSLILDEIIERATLQMG